MVCGYCGDKNHNISNCPNDNDLVNLLHSSEPVNFNNLSHKILRKIASKTSYKTCLSKKELVDIFNKIKRKNDKIKKKKVIKGDECSICYEKIGETNVCTTSCGHTFCMTCIIKMVKNNSSSSNSCPLCREQLVKNELIDDAIDEEEVRIFNNLFQNTLNDTPIRIYLDRSGDRTILQGSPTSTAEINDDITIADINNIVSLDTPDYLLNDAINLLENNFNLNTPPRRRLNFEEEFENRQNYINEINQENIVNTND